MVAGEDLGAAARALARGEPLRALASAGRGESAPAVLLRGIAYAQLGDLELARRSLERAVTLAPNAATNARARAALVEIAMATGDARAASTDAAKLAGTLDRLGDARNSAMLRLVQARAEVLLGHLGEARELVDDLVRAALPADLRAVAYLARAEIAVRAGRALDARDALAAARAALADTPNGLLARELVALEEELSTPVAVLIHRSDRRSADLFAIEAAGAGDALLVDACRRQATTSRATVPFAKRSVLFALLLELARVWPSGLARDELAARAFDTRRVNPSHRSRLRVEIGRLRKLMKGLAEPIATDDGYRLASSREVLVLLPAEGLDDAGRLALVLGDGASWTAQSLAEHAGVSKRTAQRALADLVERGAVVRTENGRDVRYARPGPRIASRMLLLGLVPKP